MISKDSKIYVAGHTGLLGSTLEKVLKREGFENLILRTHGELDLRDLQATNGFFREEKPDYVFMAAAKVGGLKANVESPVDFLRDNLDIQTNVISSAHKVGVLKLLFFGSNCMYPKECKQPMNEEDILTGRFEPTNQAYAIAKIAGMEMCRAYNSQYETRFITAIPASLYGPGDNFDMVNSHIVPTLIRRCHDAKIEGDVAVFLDGGKDRRRELVFVDDIAEASLFLMNNYESSEPLNIGTNKDHSIEEIAHAIKRIVGFEGDILFNESKPTGMKRKLMDSQKIQDLGWKHQIEFEEGLMESYQWFLDKVA